MPCLPRLPAYHAQICQPLCSCQIHFHGHSCAHPIYARTQTHTHVCHLPQVHHFCLLIGYGADAVCPYLAFETLVALQEDGHVPAAKSREELEDNYIKVVGCLA